MTTLTADRIGDLKSRHPDVFRRSFFARYGLLIGTLALIVYFSFAWWLFSFGPILKRADWDLAGIYLADWISYEIRPDIHMNANSLAVTYPRFSPLGADPAPDWVVIETGEVEIAAPAADTASAAAPSKGIGFLNPDAQGTSTGGASDSAPSAATGFMNPDAAGTSTGGSAEPVISFMNPNAEGTAMGASGEADAGTGAAPEALVPATEIRPVHVTARLGRGGVEVVPGKVVLTHGKETLTLAVSAENGVVPEGPLPDWAVQKYEGAKVVAYFGFAGRIEVDDDEVKVRKRFLGWENFLFDTSSPFWGRPLSETFGMILWGERIDPERSNLALAWNNILYNAEWQHLDVFIKLGQTIVMAFVGTLFASIIAFPLAFIAARNITPNRPLNHLIKRFFDFQRSVDMFIWALFFTRAFGPGPLAGISAIFFTDTGTLGKLYSEALENIDEKQREGVRSVGAQPVLVQRYGVVPQVLPVFASQSLYFWESNTRSATIIGAVGAGGIGLKLWEAMRTNSDWENVAYMVVLILIVVFLFDTISSKLRGALISKGHRT